MAPKPKAKIPLTVSLRKRLNSERDDLLHHNYNKPPRVPAKKNKTNSRMVEQVREDCISAYDPQDSGRLRMFHHSPTWHIAREAEKKGTDVSAKYLNFFENKNSKIAWSWGTAALAHLYYSLGASLRVNVKALACYTILFESWIFEHFPKLPGILKPSHSRAPEYCMSEGYFEWFNSVSFTLLCLDVVDLNENDDGGILGDGGGVSHNGHVKGRNEDLRRLEEKISNLKFEVNSLKSAKEVEDRERSELLEAMELKIVECDSLKEVNNRLETDIQAKQVVDSICENDYCETIKKLNNMVLEYETLTTINKKLMDEVLSLVVHSEGNVREVKDYKQKYKLNAKYEEVQRKLSKRDGNPIEVLEYKIVLVYLDEKETFLLEECVQSDVGCIMIWEKEVPIEVIPSPLIEQPNVVMMEDDEGPPIWPTSKVEEKDKIDEKGGNNIRKRKDNSLQSGEENTKRVKKPRASELPEEELDNLPHMYFSDDEPNIEYEGRVMRVELDWGEMLQLMLKLRLELDWWGATSNNVEEVDEVDAWNRWAKTNPDSLDVEEGYYSNHSSVDGDDGPTQADIDRCDDEFRDLAKECDNIFAAEETKVHYTILPVHNPGLEMVIGME
ncbi:hypothetical protein GIB67_024311 [Kingdonia uniflora]|uniref:Aminotransferase-like plant mobile domain-containing protein n=1 Tax=Kingdonia uniflora TaxID=39325 RepID=A0A7J7LF19_9MAGN|nr:hypothetical protein GIB67_024311 [Kingdonia uniflora]